MGHVSNPIIG